MQAALKREERKRLDEQLDFEVQLVGWTQNYNLPWHGYSLGVLCKCFMVLCETKRVSHSTLSVLPSRTAARTLHSDDEHLGSCRNGFNAEQREIFEDLIIGVQRKQVCS